MSGSAKLLIACLSLYALFPEMQAIDNNNTIEPKIVLPTKLKYQDGIPNAFRYFSFVVEAKTKPKVYGCSYLYTGNGTLPDEICLTMIKNGNAQLLDAQDTSNTSLRNKYYPHSTIANGTFWYIYEVPTSCWRSQGIYAITNDTNYTLPLSYNPVLAIRQKPTILKAGIDETSQCLSLEVGAIENGNCADVEYEINVMQIMEIQKVSCKSCKYVGSTTLDIFRFNGTLSNTLLKYEKCSIIKMVNTTVNDPRKPASSELFTVKANRVVVTAQAIIGGLRGQTSDIKSFILGNKGDGGSGNGSDDMVGAKKLVYFVLFVMMLIQGYLL